MTFSAIKIGSFAKVKGGKRLPKGAELYDEPTEHPYIRVTDMYSDGLNSFQIKYIDQQTHDSISRYTISIHDVYISIAGTIGRVGMVPDTFNGANLTENAAKITDIDSSFNPRFLMYFLRSHLGQGQIAAKTGGTSQPKLALYRIEEIYCPKLPRDMQDEIVLAAKNYDDLIENNRRRIQLLEESARLLYQEWFVHLRFPGHEQVKIIDGVPEGWEPTLVPDVIDVNPRTPVEKGKEIWYVPMSSLSETSMTANTADFERRTKHTNVKFKKNDVLLARITPCLENGKTGYAYFLAEDEVACGSTEFIVLRGKRVPSEFVYCLARSYPFRENAIKSMTGSSGRQRVQNSCFDKYAVPLPPNSILDEFVEVVQNNFDQIRNLMAQNARLAQARDLLLPKLMSGELTV